LFAGGSGLLVAARLGMPSRSDDDDEERADLSARVKQLQRDSEDGKQQWWAFCDAEGFSNRRDPNRHTADFLRRFFEARRDGMIPAGRALAAPPHEADPEMHKIWVGRIKQAQRSSPEQKQKWERYCDMWGGCVRDPQRHDSNFLRRFFDEFLAAEEAGCMGGWDPAAGGCMPGYPPVAGYPPMGGYPMQGYPPMHMGYPPMGMHPGDGQPGAEGEQMPGYPGYPPMMGGMPEGYNAWMMGGAAPPPGAAPPALENGGDGDKHKKDKDKDKKHKKKGKDKDKRKDKDKGKDKGKKRRKRKKSSSSSSSEESRSRSKARVRRKRKKRSKTTTSSSSSSSSSKSL